MAHNNQDTRVPINEGYQPRNSEDRGYQPRPNNGYQPEKSGPVNPPSHGSNARSPKK